MSDGDIGYDSSYWAAVNVTMPQEEEMHTLSHGDREWLFNASLRLRIIDCALPGLKEFDEAKRLVLATDYCRFVEHRLVQLHEWKKWTEYEQAQAQKLGKRQKPDLPTPSIKSSISLVGPKLEGSSNPEDPRNVAQRKKSEENDVKSIAESHSSSTQLPPPIPDRPRPGLPLRIEPEEPKQLGPLPPAGPNSVSISSSASESTPQKDDPESTVVKQEEVVSSESQQVAVSENIDTSSWSREAAYRTYEALVDAFVTVVTFFSDVFLEQEPTSVSEFTAGNPAFPAILVFKMLSIWLSLHCLEKPTILGRSMEPANNILEMIRALPRPIKFTDSSEPLAEHRSHLFGTAFTGDGLVLIGNVELVRTWDIASHLYFDRPNRRLYIFITGAFCYSQNRFCDSQRVSYKAHWRLPAGEHMYPEVPAPTAIPLKYTQEVSRTLTILFDKTSKGRKIFRDFQKSFRDLKPLMPPMRLRNRKIGLLWTEEGKHSTSNQYLNATNRALGRSTYHLEDFPYFAERLLILEQYLNEVRPSTFRQLMRDSRDQLQYHTFIVAFVVFILTVVGLILSILQTIASFMQVSLALKQNETG